MGLCNAAAVVITALAFLATPVGASAPINAGDSDIPAPLVTQQVDMQDLVTLGGNTRSEANPSNDRGAVAAAMPLEHLELQLQRSSAGEGRVQSFIEALHDPASPRFHEWLTAEDFGRRFGAAPADIAAVEAWLSGYGFRLGPVYPGGMVIDFSGTAGQVTAAFHTAIHRLEVRGEAHFANMSDPEIPRALAPVVAGIVKLNDFRAQRKHRPRPKFTGSCDGDRCYLMAPADLATIYDFNSLFLAEAPITGKGQKIAVAEDTDLYTDSDWSNFRRIFGLDRYRDGSLSTIHPPPPGGGPACRDPGVNPNGDDVEATLDAEWSSAAAPDATILVAACKDSATIDGVLQAIHHLIVSPTPPPIISVSYGLCETENGAAVNAYFNAMYQQAAAEGISVFVATGDSGSEDCAPNYTAPAFLGTGINGWASTPNNVAVGGTDFSDTYAGTNALYWGPSTGAPWGTAKSYIPEMAWNDTCASDQVFTSMGYTRAYGTDGFCNSAAADPYYLGTGGGEGGPSGCASGTPAIHGVVGGSCRGWPKPSYQAHLFGMPQDGVRDVPDVSMFASDGWEWNHQYLICFSDPNNGGIPCVGNPATWGQGGGGTSYSTPIVAGIQALVNQRMGDRQGNPNFVYYALAARQYGARGNPQCDSSLGADGNSHCVFHDVTVGNDSQDCVGRQDCFRPSGKYGVLSTSDSRYEPAFVAHPGYDFPSGIGTIDAGNLVKYWDSAWAAAAPNPDP
jgi:subtilase family serine protease